MADNLDNKVIITAAITGGGTTKAMNPSVPITPEEIAEDAYRCWQAGAAVVHIHVRDEQGNRSMDPMVFQKAVRLIRAKTDCDIVINCTSSGTTETLRDEDRMGHFPLIKEIEIGSLDAGTMNWACGTIFENSPRFLEKLARLYLEEGIRPEIEIFDAGMLGNAKYYMKQGLIPSPAYFQFVLGVLGGEEATVEALLHLKNQLPENAIWSAFGVGRGHLPILYATLALGGHVRVGLEDNIYYLKGQLATNVQLVERAARIIREFGKQPATPDEARQILGIQPRG